MNKTQKIILSVGALVVLAMLIYPPFCFEVKGSKIDPQFGFIFSPPGYNHVINVSQLFIQIFAVLVIVALAFFIFTGSSIPSGRNDVSNIAEETNTPVVRERFSEASRKAFKYAKYAFFFGAFIAIKVIYQNQGLRSAISEGNYIEPIAAFVMGAFGLAALVFIVVFVINSIFKDAIL